MPHFEIQSGGVLRYEVCEACDGSGCSHKWVIEPASGDMVLEPCELCEGDGYTLHEPWKEVRQ